MLKELRQKHDEKYDKNRKKVDNNIENTKKENSKNKLTKKIQKECRDNIILKATLEDLNKAGFKEEFINKLNENEKFYLKSLSDLQVKLMMNDVIHPKQL